MYTVTDLCSLCLASSTNNIISILSKDDDGIVVKHKLEYALTEVMNYKPEIMKNICSDCLKQLNYVYKFKQKCLQNVMSLNDFIEKMTVENEELHLVTTTEEVQHQVITANHFLASSTPNDPVIIYENMDTHSIPNKEIQESSELKSIVKHEPKDIYDDSEMQYNSTNNTANILMINAECSSLSTNIVYMKQSQSFYENQIVENNKETKNVKEELEYIHDEIDIKNDPLLSEEENSIDALHNEATNNTEESTEAQSFFPVKSKERYENAYQQFEAWYNKKGMKVIREDTLLEYFEEKSKILKSTSLWSLFSMLRTTLALNKNIDIRKFARLIAFIKRKSIGQKSKTSSVLTKSDIERFLTEADDSTYLLMKVVLIIGISGACGRDELTYLQLQNIKDKGSSIVIDIPHGRKPNERREFTITSGSIEGVDLIDIFRKYISLRPPGIDNTRLFLGYRNGKCTKQSVGQHSIGGFPKRIAEFLKLPDPANYTGHCFRRSSAAVLAAASSCFITDNVKRLGGWI